MDARRIYATGHSNGGGFTYLLWAERGGVFAALAPSSSVLARGFQKFAPKPVLHVASPQDELVKFAWQQRMIDHVLRLNGCEPFKPGAIGYTYYASSQVFHRITGCFLQPLADQPAPVGFRRFFQG